MSAPPVNLDATQTPGNPVTSPVRRAMVYTGLVLLAVVMALPFVAMFLMSLRPEDVTGLREIFFSPHFTLDNYRDNLRNDSMVRWFLNSFIYAGVSVALVLLLCTMAGYAFAKKEF